MTHQRARSQQNASNNAQQYIRVDEEIEILLDKPIPLKMEKERCSNSNGSLHLSSMKKDSEHKYKSDLIEYADDCPEAKFESQKAFYSNAQLLHKKNRSCMLINSIRTKSTPEMKHLSNGSVGKSEKLCDNKFNHKADLQPRQGRKLWKKQDHKIHSNTPKVNMNENLMENGSVNSVNKIKTVNFYSNFSSPIHVVNEADTPPFTPNIDISCRNASASRLCSQPDVIYLETKPASRATKARLSSAKKKFNVTSKQANVKEKKETKAIIKEKKTAKREMNALYKNLAEISWAQKEDFTSLLKSNSGKIKATVTNRSRALSKLQKNNAQVAENKTVSQTPNSSVLRKKSLVLSRKHMPTVKPKARSVLSTIVKKKLQKSAKIVLKKKSAHPIFKKPVHKEDDDESLVRYKFNPSFIKSVNLASDNKTVVKKKKVAEEPSSPPSPIPPPMKKLKKTEEATDASNVNNDNVVMRRESSFDKLAVWGNLFQSPETNLLSVLQKRQELRVTLEPLDTPNMFLQVCEDRDKIPDITEAYTRKSLQQSMLRVFTGVDQKHISSVLRDNSDTKSPSSNGSKASRKRKYDEESVRSSVRQSECAFRYKEIVVKKHENYIQIVLVPNMYKQNCLTIEAMKELKEAFLSARKDTNCKAVLLNSSGSFFCSGIDLAQLHGSNKKHNAEEMAITIRDLILTLAIFPKPVVAAVNGYAIGLGVTLLTFCDVVLSSDKATFCIPSTRLGYVPEGGALLTLPQVVGSTVAIEMLLQGRRLTAEQALKYGLVSEVLWPTQLMEEVVPRILSLVKQPLHVMEATKTMVRCHLWEKLAVQLNQEWRMLPSQWLSSICQQNIKQHLQTGWLLN